MGSLGLSASPALSPQWWPAASRPQRRPSVHVFPGPRGAELRAPACSSPPRSRPVGPSFRPAHLSCSRGLGLVPWLCDGTVGVRGPLKSSRHSCVQVCVLVRHHVRTVSVSGWDPRLPRPPCSGRSGLGRRPPPPAPHPVSICSCHSPLDSLFVGYVLVSSLSLWLILIHLIYRGRQKATKNVLELFFLGDTGFLGSVEMEVS